MASAIINFSVLQGDTFKKTVTFKDPAGVPIDLTGATISGKVGNKKIVDDKEFTVTVIGDADEGRFSFELSAAETAAFPVGSYRYYVQIAYTNGVVQTLLNGNFIIAETGV